MWRESQWLNLHFCLNRGIIVSIHVSWVYSVSTETLIFHSVTLGTFHTQVIHCQTVNSFIHIFIMSMFAYCISAGFDSNTTESHQNSSEFSWLSHYLHMNAAQVRSATLQGIYIYSIIILVNSWFLVILIEVSLKFCLKNSKTNTKRNFQSLKDRTKISFPLS